MSDPQPQLPSASQPQGPALPPNDEGHKLLLLALLTVVNMLSITIRVLVPGIVETDKHDTLGHPGLALLVYFLLLLSYLMASMVLFFLVHQYRPIRPVEIHWMVPLTVFGLAVYYLFLWHNIGAFFVLAGFPAALTFAMNVIIVMALFDPVRTIKRAYESICRCLSPSRL